MLGTGVLSGSSADYPFGAGTISDAEARLPKGRHLLPQLLFAFGRFNSRKERRDLPCGCGVGAFQADGAHVAQQIVRIAHVVEAEAGGDSQIARNPPFVGDISAHAPRAHVDRGITFRRLRARWIAEQKRGKVEPALVRGKAQRPARQVGGAAVHRGMDD